MRFTKAQTKLYNEITKIMKDNYSDYYAEEYDERWNCEEYNKYIKIFKEEIRTIGFCLTTPNTYSQMIAFVDANK